MHKDGQVDTKAWPAPAGDRQNLPDAAVIQRSMADPECFTELYDRHAPVIHRYAAQRLGSDAADDLVAETFLIAFRKRGRYDLTRPGALPWLYGIATRLIAGHRKAEVKRLRLRERIGETAGAVPGVLEGTSAPAELGEALARALANLPKAFRDVVLLVAWADLSYEEVAAALCIPVGTVRSRLSRARARLRTDLHSAGSASCDDGSSNG